MIKASKARVKASRFTNYEKNYRLKKVLQPHTYVYSCGIPTRYTETTFENVVK